jgi:hypothetical protein
MMNPRLKKAITAILLTATLVGSAIGYIDLIQKKPENTVGKSEFIFKKDELNELEKWKDQPFEEILSSAFSGDAAGLYVIGICFLEGTGGCTIDPRTAHAYFAASASLGYAPAIDQIRSLYLYEHQNPFLALVYENLIVSLGHPELLTSYHGLRSDLSKDLGHKFSKEIEGIAALKKKTILSNINELQKIEDKHHYIANFCLTGGIMKDDHLLGVKYWTPPA